MRNDRLKECDADLNRRSRGVARYTDIYASPEVLFVGHVMSSGSSQRPVTMLPGRNHDAVCGFHACSLNGTRAAMLLRLLDYHSEPYGDILLGLKDQSVCVARTFVPRRFP